ncbi:NAD-dependent epimerase/dehydratase family protein, partial [bacterium]|nr:NAD-dependent epimerase/dehydratase family protein [Candidatus Elulimicrobium humile]
MRVLITGGKGFVGSYLAKNLRADNILAVGKEQLDLLNTEEVNNFFNKNTFDVVIHTALVGR